MDARRGVLRTLMSLVVLFMVFWSFAYVLHPGEVGNSFVDLVLAERVFWPCLVAAAILLVWIVMGFWSRT